MREPAVVESTHREKYVARPIVGVRVKAVDATDALLMFTRFARLHYARARVHDGR